MLNKSRYIMLVFTTFLWTAELSNSALHNKEGKTKINLLHSNIESTTINVSVEGYSFEEYVVDGDIAYKVLIEKGVPILSRGNPDLPKLYTSIVIPDNSAMKIEILSNEYHEINDVNILPSKGNLSRDINPASIPYEYNDSYSENKFYPEEIASLGDPYILRNVRGQSVIINPIQYNPITKTVRVYSNIKLKVVENQKVLFGKNTFKSSRKASQKKVLKEYNKIYDDLFINYSRDTRFEYLNDFGEMLVICYDDFIDEMEPFVDWKNRKGIKTTIVGISEVGSSSSSIQDYVNNFYYESNLTYLLLVGDVAQIPTPIINGASSDPSYGFIEGNDSYAEVIVGRFSANNPGQLQTQIDRTLTYEQEPSYVNHFSSALGIASNQGPGYGGLSDDAFNDLLWDDLLSPFTYDDYQGIYDPNGSVSQGVDAINNGVGVINYTGHAGPTGWGNGAPLSVSDVHQLTNTDKLPFIFTVGCNPGEFNNYGECFCEAWMWATDSNGNPTGSVGHVGSTISQSWEPPMHGQWAMNAILAESYDTNVSRSFGGITANGCMHMNEAQGSNGVNETNHWTIFGDPSILVRTDEPSMLNPQYNSTLLVGQSELVIDVGVNDALAALSVGGELLVSAVSNGGVAVLDLSDIVLIPGTIDLVITSFNTYPHIESLNITSPNGPYLAFDSIDIVSFDSNNQIDFGEQIEMNLLVENVGNMNTNAINVSVTSNDEYISMIIDESIIAYAIASEITQTESPISFLVANSVPDGHLAQFNAILNDGSNEWVLSFNLELHAPVFEIENPAFEDSNVDGIWDPGEQAIITVDLLNSGSSPFNLYPGAMITTDNPYVNILSGENDNTFYMIDAYDSYVGEFLVESSVETPLNTEVIFNISWGYSPTNTCEGNCVEEANLTYTVIIGHPSIIIWDPTSQHISGNRLVDFFESNNIAGFDYIDNNSLPNIENYQTAFVFLGVYSDNYVLQNDDANIFIDFLNNGGNVYMEGGDTWAFDIPTALHDMFGLEGEADGSADLSIINGILGTFAEGLSFSYNGGNSYVDRLIPSGGVAILENESPSYYTAIAYDSPLGYRTVGASHDLGGLQGDGFNDYVNGILDFFNNETGTIEPECSIGDINNDNNLDITDIIRLVNIIIYAGAPPSDIELCASDVNSDGLINILDVISIVNLILDQTTSGRSFSRLESPVKKIELFDEGNKLILNTSGKIRGLEIVLDSKYSNIDFNNNLNMNFAHNKIDDEHYILIYSLDGEYISAGKHELLEIDGKFLIDDCIAANSNNDYVEVQFLKTNPEKFILKQNFPNPFNPSTNISFELGKSSFVKLIVYDINGQKVRELINGIYSANEHTVVWDGTDQYGNLVSSGMYFYSLVSNNEIQTNKMLFLK